MADRRHDDEKAVALAFLRSGHPWLAFGVVMVKSSVRVASATLLLGGYFLLEHGGATSALAKILHIE